jgi:hypothetical protein
LHPSGGTSDAENPHFHPTNSSHYVGRSSIPATLGVLEEDNEPGIFLADVWDPSVVQVFGDDFDLELAHCPLLVAIKRLSPAIPTPTMQAYLDDANPLFIPEGELVSSTVTIDPSHNTYRSFFLPKICSPPIGLAWSLTIGFDAFIDSVAILGKSYKPFLHVNEALTPALTAWFLAVLAHPDAFSVKACRYTELLAAHCPSLTDGAYPTAITDSRGFSPLLDMRNGLAWRLHCDSYLATTVGPGLVHFQTYLARGKAGITTDTYLGAIIPGRLCPNFGYHFQTLNS